MILDLGLQFAATALLLYGLWQMGNNKRRGPFLAATSETIWIAVGFVHGVWGLILLSIILAVMQARNFYKWTKDGLPW